MKYFIIGLLLLAAILAFSVRSGQMLSTRLDTVITPLEQAGAQSAQSARLLRRAQQRWEDIRPCLSAYLDHKALDEISLAFAALEDAEAADRAPACQSLLVLLRALSEHDRLLLQNLL